jgi:hypothetical protein
VSGITSPAMPSISIIRSRPAYKTLMFAAALLPSLPRSTSNDTF